ncbi:hypothetical protein [Carnobacterium sp.]|uniref:hypothetical protein n=1 Tax=Carnobacterium sp. TaxID=48221 RepID=UPI002FCA9C3C
MFILLTSVTGLDEINVITFIPILSAIISMVSAIYVLSMGKKLERKVKQDEQTKWVDRMIQVATQSSKEFSEHELLQILSCLRPLKRKYNNEDLELTSWENFSNDSIEYCEVLLNKRTEVEVKLKLTITEIDICRLIANTLLKNHWEYLSYENHSSLCKTGALLLSYFFPKIKPERCYKGIKDLNILFDSVCIKIKAQ